MNEISTNPKATFQTSTYNSSDREKI